MDNQITALDFLNNKAQIWELMEFATCGLEFPCEDGKIARIIDPEED